MKKVKEEKQADLKFVDSNELKAIKDRQEAVDKYLFEVGVIESRKHALLHELSEANKRLESYKEILMDKYGEQFSYRTKGAGERAFKPFG